MRLIFRVPTLPLVHTEIKPGQWKIEKIAGSWPDDLRLELDMKRVGTAPSSKRTSYRWSDGSWEVLNEPYSSAFIHHLPWAGDRILEVRRPFFKSKYTMKWIKGDGPLPTFAEPASSSDVRYEFLNGSFVIGDETFVHGRSCINKHYVLENLQACKENKWVIDHFPAGSFQGEAMPPPFKEYYGSDVIPISRNSWYAIGTCNFEEEKGAREVCLSHFDGNTWSWIEAPHRMPLQRIEITRDETVWMVTGGDATAGMASFTVLDYFSRPPMPVGELRRWQAGRCWQRLRLPDSPIQLEGWKYLRFVPMEVAAADVDDIWVSGYWYYVRRPSADRLEMKKVGGLLHLHHKIKWPCGGFW